MADAGQSHMALDQQATRRAAIVDIGSNSVRLVVYDGPHRAPMPIFNEKLMVGLGSSLATSGRIEDGAFRRGIAALARFRALIDAMGLTDVRCVATAAVRDASNGAEFLAEARAVGLDIELLSGTQEATAAGLGVISAHPDADGIVADLGGGSLELVRVRSGEVVRGTSFPLGVLRIAALRQKSGKGFRASIAKLLRAAGWPGDDRQLPLYLVGGSWRALARYDLMLTRDPLPVISGHRMDQNAPARLARRLARTSIAELKAIEGLATSRVESMPDAAVLLGALVSALGTSELIVSSSGLREGLLYQRLSAREREIDPLLAAAAHEGARFSRFAPHGPLIDGWIAPLFADEAPQLLRLRLAACLMSDVASSANPDFRADRAVEMALHGNLMGIDPPERQILAQAMSSASGGAGRLFNLRTALASGRDLKRAMWWGAAIRLAQRLSGGALEPLQQTALTLDDQRVTLTVSPNARALIGEQVEKRLRQLATAMARAPAIIVGQLPN